MPPNDHSSKTEYPKIPFTPLAVVTILFKSQEQVVNQRFESINLWIKWTV